MAASRRTRISVAAILAYVATQLPMAGMCSTWQWFLSIQDGGCRKLRKYNFGLSANMGFRLLLLLLLFRLELFSV